MSKLFNYLIAGNPVPQRLRGASHYSIASAKSWNGPSILSPSSPPVNSLYWNLSRSLYTGLPQTIDDWIPKEEPKKGDNFLGIDRSMDPTRLAGIRVVASLSLESESHFVDEIITAAALIFREGGTADSVFLPENIITVSQINGPHGKLQVYPDCTLTDSIYVVQLNTWFRDQCLMCTHPEWNARIDPYRISEVKTSKTCDCGAHAVNSSIHSGYCSLNEMR